MGICASLPSGGKSGAGDGHQLFGEREWTENPYGLKRKNRKLLRLGRIV